MESVMNQGLKRKELKGEGKKMKGWVRVPITGADAQMETIVCPFVRNVFDSSLKGRHGYLMRKCDYEGASLLMAFILGEIMEQALRQSLLMSHGSFSIFFSGPISAFTMALALALIASNFIPFLIKRRLRVEG